LLPSIFLAISHADSSPKEFLFVMAFALPCLAIMICYARIFYIVRKTAMKTHEVQPKPNGSIRMSHNHVTNNHSHANKLPNAAESVVVRRGGEVPTNHNNNRQQQQQHRLSFQADDDNCSKNSSSGYGNGQRMRRILSKTKEEELKFIDTSVESDLPPTLSQLQRKSVQISFEHPTLSSPSSLTLTPTTATTTVNSLESEQLHSISRDVDGVTPAAAAAKDLPVDSAVEDSTTTASIEQVRL